MGKLLEYPEPDIEKEIEKNGFKITIEVCKSVKGGWILDIVDEKRNPTVWEDLFPSAKDALDEGIKAIEEEGIQSFIDNSKE